MKTFARWAVSVSILGTILLAGCSSSGTPANGGGSTVTPGPPLATGGATTLYAVQSNLFIDGATPDAILSFSATATGTVTPSAALNAPSGVVFTNVATDTAGNLYVSALFVTVTSTAITPTGVSEILVYPAGSTGTATPSRTITGASTGLTYPFSLAIDSTGQLYVGQTTDYQEATQGTGSILVFPSGANGNTAPARTIAGSATGLSSPSSLAVDTTGQLYEADYNGGSVFAFAAGANGNVAPTRILDGLAGGAYGVAVDTGNNLYVTGVDSTQSYGIIAEFAPTAGNTTPPLRTIGGAGLGATYSIGNLLVDRVGNIYVPYAYSSTGYALAAFGPTATGDVGPATRQSLSGGRFYDYYLSIALH